MYTYHQLLSNYWGFNINAIMKCGTVVIMQCLIGRVKKIKMLLVSSSNRAFLSP